jgi:hypothetical protein
MYNLAWGQEYNLELMLKGEKGVACHMNDQQRSALVNVSGLTALIAFTCLVYLRTQQPIILVIGGLISVVGVVGTMMR